MKVSEAFLVNTKNFDSIIETLANYNTEGIAINSNLMERLSYSDPNDLLVLRILKDFSIIDNNGQPDKFFDEFQNPETTKKALAKGFIEAYQGIFEQHPTIHHNSIDKIKEAFEEYFNGKKTDLIIKYIAGTFEKVVSYVGVATIEKVLKEKTEGTEGTTITQSTVQNRNNGKVANQHGDQTIVTKEEISENNLDDLLSDFETPEMDSPSSVSTDDETEKSSKNDKSDDDSSIQEFVNTIESYDDENDQSDEIESTDNPENKKSNSTEDLSKDDEDIFGFEPDKSSSHQAAPTKRSDNKENTDVAPIELDMPMSMATKTATNMQNLKTEHQFVQKALVRKADLLHKMKRWEDLLPTLEQIISRYDNTEDNALSNAVEQAIIRRAIALLKLGRSDKALPALDAVITRFRDSDNNEFYEQASRAMLYKCNILEKQHASTEELLPIYNAIINRMDSSSEILLKEKLDEIHCKRFDLLINTNESTDLLDASKQLIQRFKDSDNHQDYLQKAMIIQAETLDQMGEDEAALQAYDEFLKKFGN